MLLLSILTICIINLIIWAVVFRPQSQFINEQSKRILLLIERINENDANFVYVKSDAKAKLEQIEEKHHRELLQAQREVSDWKIKEEKRIRADAIARSEVVNHGFAAENFAPLLTGYDHKDFRHLGDPIDFLVCVGANQVRAGTQDTIDAVILLDIKTGGANLNKVQRRIRDAVAEGKVHFAVYNPDNKTTRYWPALPTKTTKE